MKRVPTRSFSVAESSFRFFALREVMVPRDSGCWQSGYLLSSAKLAYERESEAQIHAHCAHI